MTTVADVAAETRRTVEEVLAACRTHGIVASGPGSGLSSVEHERLREALGASALPPVTRGSTTERPGAPAGGPPAAGQEAASRRLSPRTATRIGLAVFLVVAVVVAVVSLRSRAEDDGRCVDLPASGPVDVPCDLAHDAEVIGVHELADGPFPGREALLAAAEGPCGDAVAERVADDRRSGLELVLLVPTERTWARGDRVVTCLVEAPAGTLVGSVTGSPG